MRAAELLHRVRAAGFVIEATDGKLVVAPWSKLPDEMRAALRAAKPELLHELASTTPPAGADASSRTPMRPYALTKADADRCHALPWDDAACARFVARVGLFLRHGFNAEDADDLAERLYLRDRDLDDRHLCIECRHCGGRAPAWRCARPLASGIGPDLGALVTLPQRCPAFLLAIGEDPSEHVDNGA
jgi:hypothetical protein